MLTGVGVFRGFRDAYGAVVLVDGDPIQWERSLALRSHSPTGIEWGYLGSGPAQLALSILLYVTDEAPALEHYQTFKDRVVSQLPRHRGWRFSSAHVAGWLNAMVDGDDAGAREWARRMVS